MPEFTDDRPPPNYSPMEELRGCSIVDRTLGLKLAFHEMPATEEAWEAANSISKANNASHGWPRFVPARVYADGSFEINLREFGR
jgi:hypothetical protein